MIRCRRSGRDPPLARIETVSVRAPGRGSGAVDLSAGRGAWVLGTQVFAVNARDPLAITFNCSSRSVEPP
jgi:hypothetical protein